MPIKLIGLEYKEFAHPMDMKAVKSLEVIPFVRLIIGKMEDQTYRLYLRTNILGNCIKLTEENATHICEIVKEVCGILDYDVVPEIYAKREFSLTIKPYGFQTPVLIIPDLLLYKEDSMIRFHVGRAITKLKSGRIQFYTLAQLTYEGMNNLLPEAVSTVMGASMIAWLRKAEISADRGGLLANQDYNMAMKYFMTVAGVHISEYGGISVQEYVDEIDESIESESFLTKLGRNIKNLGNATGFYNDRIKELYRWYMSGEYDDILEKYS